MANTYSWCNIDFFFGQNSAATVAVATLSTCGFYQCAAMNLDPPPDKTVVLVSATPLEGFMRSMHARTLFLLFLYTRNPHARRDALTASGPTRSLPATVSCTSLSRAESVKSVYSEAWVRWNCQCVFYSVCFYRSNLTSHSCTIITHHTEILTILHLPQPRHMQNICHLKCSEVNSQIPE